MGLLASAYMALDDWCGAVILDVLAERDRQERRCEEKRAEGFDWHSCASSRLTDGERLAVLVEEVGEVARELCEARAAGDLAADEMRAHFARLREELVQVAAVTVAWIEGIDAVYPVDAGAREAPVAHGGAS
jgi:hypothetical protein